jgi:UDP-3-O-[3-hydroxymyristoyl] glucosamine N-acyltransferase
MMDDARKYFSLTEIAGHLGARVLGDAAVRVFQVASLESATAGNLTFITHRRFLPALAHTGASAVIVGEDLSEATGLPRVVCKNPYAAYARVATLFNPVMPPKPGVHPSAQVHALAKIADSASIGPCAVVEEGVSLARGVVVGAGCFVGRGTRIGEFSTLHPRAVIYHDCVIGARAVVHSGAVIGADGFGMAMEQGRWLKIPQIGRVVIGDDVEVGANTTIDRGAMDDTIVEDDVKLDNQIQIGHNCWIGAHTAIAGCVGIAGSAKIGRNCRLGGGAMIAGHLSIADGVEISGGTLVAKSITIPGTYTAVFPMSAHEDWLKNASLIRRLHDLHARIRDLETKQRTAQGSNK